MTGNSLAAMRLSSAASARAAHARSRTRLNLHGKYAGERPPLRLPRSGNGNPLALAPPRLGQCRWPPKFANGPGPGLGFSRRGGLAVGINLNSGPFKTLLGKGHTT